MGCSYAPPAKLGKCEHRQDEEKWNSELTQNGSYMARTDQQHACCLCTLGVQQKQLSELAQEFDASCLTGCV